MEEKALRVLGFAYRSFSKHQRAHEQDLIFLGFIGMLDPPRKEVKDAITQAKNAGIKIKIITGDSVATATAIARQIGVSGAVITGEQLDMMNENQLYGYIDRIAVFARTTPQQKLKITKVLQKKQEIVAITGDGINDVLALKSADVGVAMGQRGTDVARDTADIILIDDNFASIVEGIKEGRRVYDNIKKVTKFFLAVNFSEIILIMAALLMRYPLPLLPLQILWLNLITDSLPALALVFEKPENVMKTKPRKEKTLFTGIKSFLIFGGILAFASEFLIYFLAIKENIDIAQVRTLVLTGAILFELFFVYTCRSNKPLTKIKIFSNKYLNLAVFISLAMHFILLYTPLANVFGVVPLTLSNWLFVLPFAFSGLIFFEIAKYIKSRF